MSKERLIQEFKSNQPIILFAGAGLSRYAGYPMGVQLIQHLYNRLSPSEQKIISEVTGYDPVNPKSIPDLAEFAGAIENMQDSSRHLLHSVLLELFGAHPQSIHTHEQLALIPNIKHIITTNYDPLFEIAFKIYNPVINSQALPFIRDDRPTLYKIHGSLYDMSNFVITQDDFVQFNKTVNPSVWNHLKGLMSRYTVVFMGYSVEDTNVRNIILEIKNDLGGNMKPMYVVSPNNSAYVVDKLKRKNLLHINMTGEAFVDELIEELNIMPILTMASGPVTDTSIYASEEVKAKLGQPGLGRFFAIDNSIRLVQLGLEGYSEHKSDSLEVQCFIPEGLDIDPSIHNPSTENLYTSIEHFDDNIKLYLKNHKSFKYIEPKDDIKQKPNQWKIGMYSIELPTQFPKENPVAIKVRPLSYLATELFNRCVVKGKAKKLNKVEHDYHELLELYESYAAAFLAVDEHTTPESYDFLFPSQLFVEMAILTSDNKIMLVRKTVGAGAGVVAELGKAWTCGPEFGLTFEFLQDNRSINLYAAIARGLESEFGVPSNKIRKWHIEGLCLALVHLNTALYGYCMVDLSGDELIKSFKNKHSGQFDHTIEPELIELKDIPKILKRDRRYDGFSWHPTAKIRLHSLLIL